MADEGDLAKKSEDFHNRIALIAAFRNKGSAAMSNRYCEDCGGEIPDKRRLAERGCTRCVVCQNKAEGRGKGEIS
jgi:phage/conjugal plasmid C-4 type zinc finger TraR family protein